MLCLSNYLVPLAPLPHKYACTRVPKQVQSHYLLQDSGGMSKRAVVLVVLVIVVVVTAILLLALCISSSSGSCSETSIKKNKKISAFSVPSPFLPIFHLSFTYKTQTDKTQNCLPPPPKSTNTPVKPISSFFFYLFQTKHHPPPPRKKTYKNKRDQKGGKEVLPIHPFFIPPPPFLPLSSSLPSILSSLPLP